MEYPVSTDSQGQTEIFASAASPEQKVHSDEYGYRTVLIRFSYFSALVRPNGRILDIRVSAGSHFRSIPSYHFPIGYSAKCLTVY